MVTKLKKVKDPGSAITHFIGMLMALFSTLPLLLRAYKFSDPIHLISLSIFAVSMILLYTASTVYHTFNLTDKINKRLKKFDHMMIFILIAGTYTPICLVALRNNGGIPLLVIIWSMAILGILFKAFWVTCPKWLSSVIYIAMGWTCVFAFSPLLDSIPMQGFLWLLLGGVIYTIGGVIYALKLPIFNNKHKYFGSHEIFHLFVMGGTFCHFMLMYQFISILP